MIKIHAKAYSSSTGWSDDYQDWLVNRDQISWCNPLKFEVYLVGNKQFQVLGKEWPEFEKQLTNGGTATEAK